jgi:hypothetical protein
LKERRFPFGDSLTVCGLWIELQENFQRAQLRADLGDASEEFLILDSPVLGIDVQQCVRCELDQPIEWGRFRAVHETDDPTQDTRAHTRRVGVSVRLYRERERVARREHLN